MTLTLRHLRYLHALAMTGHFGRAAERSAVSQPALSARIRELELLFGGELFERRPGGAAPTALGREVIARAGSILDQVADLERLAARQAEPLSGALAFGVIPSIAPYFLPSLLPHLAATYPRLALRLRETVTMNLVGELVSGAIDLAMLSLPVGQAGLTELPLFDDPFLLAVPAGMAEPPDGDWLGAMRGAGDLLLLEDGHCLREQTVAICGGVIGPFGRASGLASLETVMQLVAAGQGVTLVPRLFCERQPGGLPEGLRIVPLSPPAPARRIGLVWRASDPRQADYRALGAAMLAIAPRPAESAPAGIE